jgi:YD repeat-containing protein
LISIAVCAMMLVSQTPSNGAKATVVITKGGVKNASSSRRAIQHASQSQRNYRDGEVLVRFREDAPEQGINQLLSVHGARLGNSLRGGSRVVKLVIPSGQEPMVVATALRASSVVEFAEPNYLIAADQLGGTRDPRFDEQWALHNSGATGGKAGADIGVVGMWPVARGSARTVIAVIDSGVDFTHPDLQANRWHNRRETINKKDDDGNGFTDDLSGWDFVTDSGAEMGAHGHGTAIAGLIAARGNNGIGVSGVMWEAGLLSLRVLDGAGMGDVAAAVEALDYAAVKGASVINCSWGTSEKSAALADAIERVGRQGALVIASAGNHGQNIEAVPHYPAAYDLPNMIAVAATDDRDELSLESNWGATRVSVAAPGTAVLTTKVGGEYEAISGSSASAALATGVGGLLKSLNPRLTVEQLRRSIISGVRPVPSLTAKVKAGGVINAGGALEALKEQVANAWRGRRGNGGGNNDSGNGVTSDAGGRAVGDGESHRFRVPVEKPTRVLPAPWIDLPNLDELRTRQPREPHAPPPIPSTRFGQGDGPRISQGGDATAQPLMMLAGLTNQLSRPLSALLNVVGDYALNVPERDYLGELGKRYVTDAKAGLRPATTTIYDSENAKLPNLRTIISNTKPAISVLAFQSVNSSSFVSQNVPTSMIAGQSYSISVTMQNTGTSTWTASNLYRLGSQNPHDNQTWGTHRIDLTESVGPGQTTTFNFTVIAPSTPGNYNFQWRTVRDGVEWFGAYTNNVVVNVTQSGGTLNNSSFVSQTVPSSMVAGQSYPVAVTMQNTGTTTWTAGNLYRIGSQNAQDNVTWGTHRIHLIAPVGPGQTATFNFTVIAPSTPGNYNFQWRTVRDGVEWFGAYSTNVTVNVTQGSGGGQPPARLQPLNRVGTSGDDLLSRNFNWGVPLLSLKGRSGLDLGLSLSYNSLVWTKDGSTMVFDADQGDPSPGFRLGFPVIQSQHYNAQVGRYGHMLLLPSGQRVELRATGAANTYESQDSSYLKLTDNGSGLLYLWMTDGTRLSFIWRNNAYRCAEIKDRNGNYITINYDALNRLSTVIDTLGRTITFEYDAYHKPIKIKQSWQRQVLSGSSVITQTETHEWATFGYTNITIQTNFPGLALSGVGNSQSIPVLSQVGLPDGTRYNFDYSTWGQIYRITRNTQDDDGIWRPREYVHYNLPQNNGTAQGDCPRFTERRDWAENWNLVNNVATEAVTTFSPWDATGSSSEMTMPDGTTYKELYETAGWQKGLTRRTEVLLGSVLKKWTTIIWEHDAPGAPYQINPRPVDTNIYDAEGNRKRRYMVYTFYGLPSDIYEYDAIGANVLRRTHIDYNLSSVYTNRRIIGLVSGQQLYDSMGALQSKVEYGYDAGGDFLQQQGAPVRHDAAGYGSGLVAGRGNRTSVRHYDVNNLSPSVVSVVGYNTTGSPIFSRDPLGRQTSISYEDKFVNPNNPNDPNSIINNNTYAYSTTFTDAGNFSSSVQYNYDLGAVWRTQNPKGAAKRTLYDAAGRVQRITNLVSGFYTRFAYPSNNKHTERFTTLQDGGAEDYYVDFYNGHGQVRAAGGYLSYSQSGWRGQLVEHDIMGRVKRRSQMFEMAGNWIPAGDDTDGYLWTQQGYDWQGRPTLTTNPDGTTTELTYGGCGCAGKQVVTARDEIGRRQRVTSDALGRVEKTQTLLLDGTTIYSTATNTYNVRDQVTRIFEQQGENGTGQETLMTYDGHGRLLTSKTPVQTSAVSYTYFTDDTVHTTTDPRGATATYTYNSRRLVTNIVYAAPSPIPVPSPVSFTYDEASNRTGMTDGTGNHSYVYNTLSQLTSESRQFAALPNRTYTTLYDYTVSGQLKYIIDPAGSRVDYSYDLMGRLLGVAGSGAHSVPTYASNLRYRAWGAMKDIDYGNGAHGFVSYNGRLQPESMELRNVNAGYLNPTPLTMTWDYDYYADGRINHTDDLNDNRFNRKLDYDHAGRIKEAYSGREAHGLAPTNPADSPFRQTFNYDVWDNMTNRNGRLWSATQTGENSPYLNDRRQGWQYDSAGHILATDTETNVYDASGQKTVATGGANTCGNEFIIAQQYDVERRVAKRVQTKHFEGPDYSTDPPQTSCQTEVEETYYLYSAALGGAKLVELDVSGNKLKGYVYAGGVRLAKQQSFDGYNFSVTWHHSNPGSTSWVETLPGRTFVRQEMDPLGAETSTSDPFITYSVPTYEQLHSNDPYYVEGGDALNLSSGCQLNGMPLSCSEAAHMLGNGAAEFAAPTVAWSRRSKSWEFVRFNPQAGLHFTFSHFDYTPTIPGGRARGGKWHPVFSSVATSPDDGGGLPFRMGFGPAAGNGGGSASPQNYDPRADFRDYAQQLLNDERGSDCLDLALLIYKAGQVWSGNGGADAIITGLLEQLTERTSMLPGGAASDPNFRVGVGPDEPTWGQSGFRREFLDQESPNQVRHAVAYLALGYRSPLLVASDSIAWGRDIHNQPDKDLGYAANKLGSRFKGDYKKLANDFYNQICERGKHFNLQLK